MKECPVLYATLDDVRRPFEEFIEKHEKKIARAGIAKIVAPEGWQPRREGYSEDLDFAIERPIRQHATGSRGLYRGLYIEERPMSLRRFFRPQATAPDNQPPRAADPADLERKYWQNVTLRPPLYGADVPGSLFDEDCEGWNLRHLDTVLSRVLNAAGHSLPGINEPYLYFGTWRSTFAWHTEDMDLYSVNYLHYGAPKQWYCIPPSGRRRFEEVIKGMLPDLFKACPEFFRHKELIISPQLLDKHSVPYIKAVQQPREFVITFPGAYHAGYNLGYNCAESVNFGTRRWVPLGAVASVCRCNPDSVSIDMRLFRDLVPARLLPPSIFEDSSSDDGKGEGEGLEGDRNGDGDAGNNGPSEPQPVKRPRGRPRRPDPPPYVLYGGVSPYGGWSDWSTSSSSDSSEDSGSGSECESESEGGSKGRADQRWSCGGGRGRGVGRGGGGGGRGWGRGRGGRSGRGGGGGGAAVGWAGVGRPAPGGSVPPVGGGLGLGLVLGGWGTLLGGGMIGALQQQQQQQQQQGDLGVPRAPLALQVALAAQLQKLQQQQAQHQRQWQPLQLQQLQPQALQPEPQPQAALFSPQAHAQHPQHLRCEKPKQEDPQPEEEAGSDDDYVPRGAKRQRCTVPYHGGNGGSSGGTGAHATATAAATVKMEGGYGDGGNDEDGLKRAILQQYVLARSAALLQLPVREVLPGPPSTLQTPRQTSCEPLPMRAPTSALLDWTPKDAAPGPLLAPPLTLTSPSVFQSAAAAARATAKAPLAGALAAVAAAKAGLTEQPRGAACVQDEEVTSPQEAPGAAAAAQAGAAAWRRDRSQLSDTEDDPWIGPDPCFGAPSCSGTRYQYHQHHHRWASDAAPAAAAAARAPSSNLMSAGWEQRAPWRAYGQPYGRPGGDALERGYDDVAPWQQSDGAEARVSRPPDGGYETGRLDPLQEDEAAVVAMQQRSQVQERRRPGRPRKHRKPYDADVAARAAEVVEEAAAVAVPSSRNWPARRTQPDGSAAVVLVPGISPSAPPAKRPRGRPRKHPLPSTHPPADPYAQVDVDVDAEAAAEPNGRGRRRQSGAAAAASQWKGAGGGEGGVWMERGGGWEAAEGSARHWRAPGLEDSYPVEGACLLAKRPCSFPAMMPALPAEAAALREQRQPSPPLHIAVGENGPGGYRNGGAGQVEGPRGSWRDYEDAVAAKLEPPQVTGHEGAEAADPSSVHAVCTSGTGPSGWYSALEAKTWLSCFAVRGREASPGGCSASAAHAYATAVDEAAAAAVVAAPAAAAASGRAGGTTAAAHAETSRGCEAAAPHASAEPPWEPSSALPHWWTGQPTARLLEMLNVLRPAFRLGACNRS